MNPHSEAAEAYKALAKYMQKNCVKVMKNVEFPWEICEKCPFHYHRITCLIQRLPYMAKIKYFCKNCGAHMETTTSTIPEGYLQWNKAWRDEKTCEERQAYAERLRAEEEKKQAIARKFREEFFMQEALRTKTILTLIRKETLRAGLIHVFVPRKQWPNWRFRRKWKR